MAQTQIYIRGYPRTIKQADIRKTFVDFGPVKQVRMLGAYTFVTYQHLQDAQKAINEMNGNIIEDAKIKVQLAGKPKRLKGPQQKDQCRYCHKLGHWRNECPQYRKDKRKRYRHSSQSSSSSSRSRSKKHRKRRDEKRKHKRRRSPSSSSSSESSSSSSSRDSSSNSRRSSSSSEKHSKKNKSKKKQSKINEQK